MRDLLLIAALFGLVACAESTTGGADGGTGGTTTVNVACTDTLSQTVAWGPLGGLVQYRDGSSLTACRTFTHTRTPEYGSPPGSPSQSCGVELGGCDAGPIAVHDVEDALAQPDVIAALAGSVPLYGTDPTPCDGTVQGITVGSRTIQVGGECSTGPSCGAGDCVPVPPGVRALADVLASVDQASLKIGQCAQVFP